MKINTQNYETYFLLYLDNELTASEQKEVELFISENPIYKNELDIIKQTILEVDEVLFQDKVTLYRLEAMEASLNPVFKNKLYLKDVKIVDGYFTKNKIRSYSAIAALFILYFGYNSIQKQVVQSNMALNKGTSKSQLANTPVLIINKAINTNKQATYPLITNAKAGKNLAVFVTPQRENLNTPMNNTNNPNSLISEVSSADVILNINSQDIASAAVSQLANEQSTAVAQSNVVNNTTPSLNEMNTEDPDRGIYIANFEIDGDKLRGLSRRIGAFLKRNKSDKDK